MKLTELNPVWVKYGKGQGVGVRFLCPHCRECSLVLLFLNPLDGGKPVPPDDHAPGNNWGYRWARSGMTFEDLTLSPSVNAAGVGHWHGTILHGEVI